MTVYEQQLFNDFGLWYAEEVKKAIKNKPIKRKSISKPDGFESVVNASGQLHDSVRHEVTDQEVNVYALSYIDKLIFGQPPGERVEVSEIEKWLEARGLNYNARTVTRNIRAVGSSIWNEFEGRNSGLLLDIPLEQKIEELKQQLLLRSVEEIKSDFIETMKAA